MKIFRQQLGLTLVELTVVLAVSGLIAIPLTSIFGQQLRIPQKLAAEVNASRQIQKSTLVLLEDAQAAQAFELGTEPEYGTFSWVELAAPEPLPVIARYFFKPGVGEEAGLLLRELVRGAQGTAPIIILEGITEFNQVSFQVEEPAWDFDSLTGTWTYTEGKIVVLISRVHEAGAEFGEETLTETLTADFRPQELRPVALPPPR